MSERVCLWSIARGAARESARTLMSSARREGVFKDFHFWTDRPVEGAICHDLGKTKARGPLAPLKILSTALGRLHYDYFVWLDPDTFVTRAPGDLLRVLQGAPVHASLEYNAALTPKLHPDWGPCSLSNFARLMRFEGVRSRAIFTVNDAFWIVHHDVIENFCKLAGEFWWFAYRAGYRFGFGHLLAYASQMLCGNPYVHRLKHSADLWAPVRTRSHTGRIPPGGVWDYFDYFSGEILKVKPALVHPLHIERGMPS